MDTNQKTLVKLLSAAVRGQKTQDINIDGVNWNKVFEEAKAHDIYALVYPALECSYFKSRSDAAIFKEWQAAAISAGIIQIQHMDNVSKVLASFTEAGIPVIALKGLVLRELYPKPEFRTMGDADILIHKRDAKAVEKLLSKMNYRKGECDFKHTHYKHYLNLDIEVHKCLTYRNYLNSDTSDLERNAWKNAVPLNAVDTQVLTLSLQDQLLHMFLHMAEHFIHDGFGLRQLCDLVLFTECHRDGIDWSQVTADAKANCIEDFVTAISAICKKLFGLDIPGHLNCRELDEQYIDLLIHDILSGGVYGKRNIERIAVNKQLQCLNNESTGIEDKSRLLLQLSMLFPHISTLGDKYQYARKYPFLLPAAWIHRILSDGVLKKKFSLREKLILTFSEKSAQALENRIKLLQWLGLR